MHDVLRELFQDFERKAEFIRSADGWLEYTFKVPEMPGEYKVGFYHEGSDVYDVVFQYAARPGRGTFKILDDPTVGRGITVLNKVVDAVLSFADKHPVQAIHFSAEEFSRQKAYDAIAKRLGKHEGWVYIRRGSDSFILLNPEHSGPLGLGKLEPPAHQQAGKWDWSSNKDRVTFWSGAVHGTLRPLVIKPEDPVDSYQLEFRPSGGGVLSLIRNLAEMCRAVLDLEHLDERTVEDWVGDDLVLLSPRLIDVDIGSSLGPVISKLALEKIAACIREQRPRWIFKKAGDHSYHLEIPRHVTVKQPEPAVAAAVESILRGVDPETAVQENRT
jgi:hypothetical protein